MNRVHSEFGPSGLARHEGRRWSIGIVLAIALGLMLAVPLATRAFGTEDGPANYPGCGIAAWTGSCTCMLTPRGAAMGYDDFSRSVRNPAIRPRVRDPEAVLTQARRVCRLPDPAPAAAASPDTPAAAPAAPQVAAPVTAPPMAAPVAAAPVAETRTGR